MIPTEEQLPGVFAGYKTLMWPIQIIAYLLIIAGILLGVWLIRVRNVKRKSTPSLDSTHKSSGPGWSLDLSDKD